MTEPTAAICCNGHSWLLFDRPLEVVSTCRLSEVRDCLERVERYTNDGCYAAGFMAYEAGAAFDPALNMYPADTVPLVWFAICNKPTLLAVLPKTRRTTSSVKWHPSVSYDEYMEAIGAIKEYIATGATYQVNYTFRLNASFTDDPWDYFTAVASRYPAPYAGYINTGRFRICSFSPELFLSRDGSTLRMEPMKGTARRGATAEEDRQLENYLRSTEKERAENIMIVDMIRNDIGRIARSGSVRVPELCAVRRYPTVLQMISRVEGEVTGTLPDLLGALYPCASVTGAPKIQTCSIIRQLESTPRHVYCGAVGWVGPHKQCCFNVAIRTALIDTEEKRAEYGTGSGVVWDSVPEAEFGECMVKTAIVNETFHPFDGEHGLFRGNSRNRATELPGHIARENRTLHLIETMLWTAVDGYYLLDAHIDRLLRTASRFSVPLERDALLQDLSQAGMNFTATRYRVRLSVDLQGTTHIESTALVSGQDTELLTVVLADRPVESTDPYLYVKTSRRQQYASARKRIDSGDDLLFYNERNELTEFSIGNLVVRMGDGKHYTPPVRSGLLPGVFREQLLADGIVTERVLPAQELSAAKKIYRVNSVRRWQQCHVAGTEAIVHA